MNPIIVTTQTLVIISGVAMGAFILAKYPKSRLHQITFVLFWLTAAWVALELVTDYFESKEIVESAWLLRNITKIFTSFIAATIVCFAWYFPQKSPNIARYKIALIYLMAYIFGVGSFSEYDVKSARIENGNLKLDRGILHLFYILYFMGCAVYTLRFMIRRRKSSQSQITKSQIKYMTIGLGIALCISIICSLILPLLKVNQFFFIGTIAPAFAVLFWAYAIIKYQAMDIESVISRTLIWAFMVSLVLIPVYIVIYFAGSWIKKMDHWELTLFATLMFFPFLVYVRKTQLYIDRFFQREYYAMEAAIGKLMQEALLLKGIGSLAEQIANAMRTVLSVERVSLLFYYETSHGYILADSNQYGVLFPEGDPFLNWLSRHDIILEREQVKLDPKYREIRELARGYFQAMEAEVSVPLVREGQLIGVLNLGPKRGGNNFTSRDLKLLSRLRVAATVALINSALQEAQLEEHEKRVQAELIAAASGTLAHSIKNPLGIIDCDIDLLREAQDQKNWDLVKDACSELIVQRDRIANVVEGLRRSQLKQPEYILCNVNTVLREVLTEVKKANRHMQVAEKFTAGEIPQISADAAQLKMAFENLITNAYQAMESTGGSLEVCTMLTEKSGNNKESTILIEIQDTGLGSASLPEQLREALERPFVTTKKSGTGLGLWLAKKVIEENHRGKLSLSSQKHEGTTVRIILPISAISS